MQRTVPIVFVALSVVCLILIATIYNKNDTIAELTKDIKGYENIDTLSETGKKFILLYAKGSQEYEKYVSNDFFVNGIKAAEDKTDNHDSHTEDIKINYLLSNTSYSKEGYETNILYQSIELSEGFEMGNVLFKATLFWDDKNKINNLKIELVN